MVKEIIKNDKKYYRCAECGLFYVKREIADKCQSFCAMHRGKNVCDPEIAKHAVNEIADRK